MTVPREATPNAASQAGSEAIPDALPDGPILLTGAAGFIGSHTAAALARRGAAVVGLDNFDPFYDRAIKDANLAHARDAAEAAPGSFTLVEGDIRDEALVERVYADHGIAATIHLAARAGVRPSIEDPAGYASFNVGGTTVLLDRARRAHPRGAFVMASSSSVYGNNPKVPFAEDDPVDHPISPYAATKRACELTASTFHDLYAMPVCCLRFFTVFGPRQRPDLAIAKFIRMIRAGDAIPVFGDGSTSRDYTYIDDIVVGVIAALERTPRFGYRIWNLGSDRPVTLAEMIGTIARVLRADPKIDRRPMQPGDVLRTYADLARSAAELGYRATTPLEDGIKAQAAADTAPAAPAFTA